MRKERKAPHELLGRLLCAALVFILLAPLATVASADPAPPPQPAAATPLSVSVPYSVRTPEGLETHVLSPWPTLDSLHDVAWAPDGHMALAVGNHNTLVAWDAATRTARVLRNGTLGQLYGVAWSDDSTTAVAVGAYGALVRYTGAGVVDLAPYGGNAWEGVTYVPGSGFLVVGVGGAMFYLNGATRTPVTSPTNNTLLGVAYSGALGHALAVGIGGTVIEVTPAGATNLVASPVAADLQAVGFETDTGKGLITGYFETFLSYQSGAVANETHAATGGDYNDLSVVSSADPAVIALKVTVNNITTGSLLFTNGTFSNQIILGSGLAGRINDVARSPTEGYVLGVGSDGNILVAWQNGSWYNVSFPFRPALQDASWRAQGDLALIVGFNGTVELYNKTAGTMRALLVPNSNASLFGVSWAPNGTQALIVGGAHFWRYDAVLDIIQEPLGATTLDLQSVAYRPNAAEALLVGGNGYIGRWDGVALTRISSTSIMNGFFALRWHVDGTGTGDYAYAAGSNIVAKIDAPSTVSTISRFGTFYSVAFLGDDVWISGRDHQIQRYDAAFGYWDNLSLPLSLNTTSFFGIETAPGGSALLMVGDRGFAAYVNLTRIIRFDTGFSVNYTGTEYNPVTGEPLFIGQAFFSMEVREGTFPNLPPFALLSSPGNGTNWTTADTILFDASLSSDLDGDALSHTWFDNVSGYLTTAPSFGARLSAGDHTLTVFVDDHQGHNVSAGVQVHVTVAQFPPVAVIDSPSASSSFTDDENITFSAVSSSDPNIGDTLSFAWSSNLDGPLGTSSIVVAKLSAGTHTITLRVTDTTGRSDNATLVLAIRVSNYPPSPSIVSPNPGGVYHPNVAITFNGTGTSDNDSAVLAYTWLDNGAVIGTGIVFTTTLPQGVHTISLQVSDGAKVAQLNVTITVGAPLNLPPRFLAITPPNGTVLTGVAFLNGTMEIDPYGEVQRVEVIVGTAAPLTAAGQIQWIAALDTTLYANGPVAITFRASDGANTTETVRTYTIDNPFVNGAPVVEILTPGQGALVRGSTPIAGSFTDKEGNVEYVEFRVAGGAWHNATVTSTSWTASFDAGAYPNGPVVIEVRAFDGYNYSEVAVLTVNADNPAPAKGFLPGFEAAAAVLALGALVGVARAGRGARRK